MYNYVEDKEFLSRAQSACSQLMKELENLLRKEYDTNTQFFLIGSGARNMVTQNENEPIDFDYNFNIFDGFEYDEGKLKEDVRKAFNKVMKNHGLSDVSDSKSSLTTQPLNFKDEPDMKFSIDVGLVTKDNKDKWHRLKHKKTGNTHYDEYYWNEAPNSKNYGNKAKEIKKVPGAWEKVRKQYLDIKNRYLRNNDKNHPSFVCYIEAVNNVYNHLKQKGDL